MRRLTCVIAVVSFCAVSAWTQDEGPAVYNVYCRSCHDSNGDGKTAAAHKLTLPDLRSPEIQKLTDAELYDSIGNGSRHKQYPHAFLRKGLSETQVHELVGYLRTLKMKR